MTEVLIYWRDYRQNWVRQFAGERSRYWHSNAQLFGRLVAGDRLWMVTSGKNLRTEPEQAGFLVALWEVKEVLYNLGDDPAYPPDDYRYRVVADEEHVVSFGPPVPVDHILRPSGRDRAVSIGRFLQGPRKLSDEKVRLLRAAAGPQMAQQWLTGQRPPTESEPTTEQSERQVEMP